MVAECTEHLQSVNNLNYQLTGMKTVFNRIRTSQFFFYSIIVIVKEGYKLKKKFICGFCLLIALSFFLTGCFSTSISKQISNSLAVQLPSEVEIDYEDDHGGFHGDGVSIANVQFQEDEAKEILSQIQNNKDWKPTPLSENIELEFYGGEKNDVYYISDLAEKNNMPEITYGYWIFIDRYDGKERITEGEELFSESAKNYTAGIYDIETKKLYYFEYDS